MNTQLIVQILNLAQAVLNWFTSRGISRDRVFAILDTAAREGRDVTTEEVQAELDAGQAELDDTQAAIDRMGE